MTCEHGYIGTCPEGCDYDTDHDGATGENLCELCQIRPTEHFICSQCSDEMDQRYIAHVDRFDRDAGYRRHVTRRAELFGI